MTALMCPNDFEVDLYLDGELGPEESAAISRHIETCPRCRERIESETRFREALRQIPVVAPPPEFSDRLLRMAVQWVLEEKSLSEAPRHAVSETASRSAREGFYPVVSRLLLRRLRERTAAFVRSLEVVTGDFLARLDVRRAVALVLTVMMAVSQIYLGALGTGVDLGHGIPAGMDVADEAVAFLRSFSFAEFAKHVSELWWAFQAGGSGTAVIAMKAFFGAESLAAIVLGMGLALVVTWRKRRVRFSED
ncbi:MAG: zf-HC2 domain-containing protein [Firmicutes bacterium]|nr:zf-HC2 domain-containing protein [Candidatus Fermentithermobacillaceae bacterium]